jgi:hypothetical protein
LSVGNRGEDLERDAAEVWPIEACGAGASRGHHDVVAVDDGTDLSADEQVESTVELWNVSGTSPWSGWG